MKEASDKRKNESVRMNLLNECSLNRQITTISFSMVQYIFFYGIAIEGAYRKTQ